jgi:hypothetical protein
MISRIAIRLTNDIIHFTFIFIMMTRDITKKKGNDMAENKILQDTLYEEFTSIDDAEEFWDTHSLIDYTEMPAK